MLATVLLVFAAASLAPVLYRRWRAAAWMPAALAAALFVFFLLDAPEIAAGAARFETVPWSSSFNVSAGFLLDGLSLTFALLVTGVGALVLAYSVPYIGHGPRLGGFLGYLLFFLGSMLGLVLADDAITLFVFWELTSISSFFLIAFDDTAESRKNAQQALIVTSGGGLALLVGLLLLRAAGTELGLDPDTAGRLSALAGLELEAHRHYVPIVLLVAFGAFTKSAQAPFHFWLPSAMVAPTPVSAYLHSATMVKAGVYVLARLNPALGDSGLWTVLLAAVGGATLLTGGALALLQRDLKLTLAYSTIAVLGALTFLIGLGHAKALEAFGALLVAHAAYKAALFLVAGNMDHQAATRDPFVRRPLFRELPLTAVAAVLAAASMAGLPPLLGYIAKESLYVAGMTGAAAGAAGAVAVAGGTLLTAAALIASVAPFFAGPEEAGRRREAEPWMLGGPLALAALGLALGVFPGPLGEALLVPLASAVSGSAEHFELSLWHGASGAYGLALLSGAASLAVGALVYLWLIRRPPSGGKLPTRLRPLSPATLYDRTLAALWSAADRVTALLQSGLLRRYLLVVLGFAFAVVGLPMALAVKQDFYLPAFVLEVRPYEVLLGGLAAAGALLTAAVRQRVTSIAALGVTGMAIALLFAFLSAPDLAITQIMVETLMVILLVLVFRRLPPAVARYGPTRRAAHIGIASLGGVIISVLILAATPKRYPTSASEFFVAESSRRGSGNVVNEILVNFRALDTLGEITVLSIAGLGVYALLRLRPGGRR